MLVVDDIPRLKMGHRKFGGSVKVSRMSLCCKQGNRGGSVRSGSPL